MQMDSCALHCLVFDNMGMNGSSTRDLTINRVKEMQVMIM